MNWKKTTELPNDPIEKTWYLSAKGKTTREVSSAAGYRLEAIKKIVRRYNHQGQEGLVDSHYQHLGLKGFICE